MSKPRWIDGGVFRTLRSATRSRKLTIVVGPGHGSAEISSRIALKDVLGSDDRAALADDPRFKSKAEEGLHWLHLLKQACVVTTSVSDALEASFPEELDLKPRLYGPEGKGVASAFDRKDPSIVHLHGFAAEPDTLVLTAKDRKKLTRPDSRYNAFLKQAFSRTVLFTGFALDDPALNELLEDVTRVFNGHVPANIALIQSGSTDPSAALRANMHFGMSLVEFPKAVGVAGALLDVTRLLEELEVPKPATGNPPRGFTELTTAFQTEVSQADESDLLRFDDGDTASWAPIKAGAVADRTAAGAITEALLEAAPELEEGAPGKVRLVLVRGAAGDGKTTLMRKLAWDLAEKTADKKHTRIFWREDGAGLPDAYVPAESDEATAVFVIDDASELESLPAFLASLAATGLGKARVLLAADTTQWDRSGLDHRIRRAVNALDVTLTGVDEAEAEALSTGLQARGRLADGTSASDAAKGLVGGDGSAFDRLMSASGRGDITASVKSSVDALAGAGESEQLRKAYLATALVHQHGMSVSVGHLASFLGMDAAQIGDTVVGPLGRLLVSGGEGSLRTPHPMVASAAVAALAPDEAARDELNLELLKSMPQGGAQDAKALQAPSDLIRARRQQPIPPLVLGKFFTAGEGAATNDRQFWFDRGRYETDFSRWDQALSAFDQALWPRPGDAREKEHNAVVHANRARCLTSMGKKKDAQRAVEDGLRLSPQDGALLRLAEKLGGRRKPPQRRGGPRGAGGRSGAGGGGGGRPGGGGGGGRPGAGGGGRGGPGGGGGPGGRGGPGGGQQRRA